MHTHRWAAIAALLFCATAFSSPAWATVSHLWISGVGDDANDCSRTEPCQTLSYALSAVDAGGQITVLDALDGGAATISKSVTIDGRERRGGPAMVGAITISAGLTDVVTLRHLSLQGFGTESVGLQFNSGAALHLENCVVSGFTQVGVAFVPNQDSQLYAQDLHVSGSSNAALFVQPAASTATATAVVWHAWLESSGSGLTVMDDSQVTVSDTLVLGNITGVAVSTTWPAHADVNLQDVTITHSTLGLDVWAPAGSANVRLARVVALDTGTPTQISGQAVVRSFADNRFVGNANLCVPHSLTPAEAPPFLVGEMVSFGVSISLPAHAATQMAVTQGTLPEGLQVAGTTITGTPTQSGRYAFTVTASDAQGCPSSHAYSGIVCGTSLTPANLAEPIKGVPYHADITLAGASDGPVAMAVTSGALPAGITLMDGALTGTASAGDTASFTITATDSNGCTAAQTYTMGVTVPDFSLVVASKAVSLGASRSGQTQVSIAPQTYFTDAVALSCDAVSGVTCAFADATLNTGTLATTLTLTAAAAAAPATTQGAGLAALGIFGIIQAGAAQRRRIRYLLAGLLLMMTLGCSTKTAQTLQVTVRATSEGGLVHTDTVSVTLP